MKLGNNKKEIMQVKIYFGVVIIGAIITFLSLLFTISWVWALIGLGFWLFFLLSPFYGDFFEIGTDEQRDKQNRKYAYKKKRGWT